MKSDHFIVYADQNPKTTQSFALQLELFDSTARQLMNLPDPKLTDAQRVVIFIVPTLRDIAKLAGSSSIAGFYSSRVEGSQAFVPGTSGTGYEYARTILFHEYTHHLQQQSARHPIPMWVSEGFADFTSTATVGSDGSVTYGKQAPGRDFVFGKHYSVSIKDLVGESYGSLSDSGVSDLYARSWQLVSYMQGDAERRSQLAHYLAEIGKGAIPADAAASAFGDVEKFDRKLGDYARSNSLYGFRVSGNLSARGPIAVRELGPGEAAIMNIRIRSTVGVNEKTAPIVENDAKAIAARFPTDDAVQTRLAEAAFDAKDYSQATAAANAALAANPNDVHALIYRGWTALTVGEGKPEGTDWTAIRADFIRANALDNQNALSLFLFYQSFGAARERPTQNAVDALLHAMELVPQDTRVRMTAVGQLLTEGRMAEAKEAFRFIAYRPHQTEPSREWSKSVLAAMEAGDKAKALAALTKAPSSN